MAVPHSKVITRIILKESMSVS